MKKKLAIFASTELSRAGATQTAFFEEQMQNYA